MRKILAILLVVVISLSLAACGGYSFGRSQEGSPLIGTWLCMGSTYYVFDADGRGTMAGSGINWSARNGVLSICNTPILCRNRCPAPAQWRYTLDGDNLTLTSTVVPGMTFDYTRSRLNQAATGSTELRGGFVLSAAATNC